MLLPLLFSTLAAYSATNDSAATVDSTATALPDSAKPKINIAVINLEPRGGLSATEILALSDRLRGELINTGKYTVLERGQMDAILEEQDFQQTGSCSEASCIVEVGQLLAVHKIVGGSLGKVGKVYSLNLKIINVESGKIERQVADDIKCSKEELVAVHMRQIARKMVGLIPDRKREIKPWYIIVPAGIAAAAGGGVAAYLYLNRRDDSPDKERLQPIDLEVPLQ